MRRIRNLPLACAALLFVACGQQAQPPADTSEPQAPATTATIWPKALNPFGDGYPKAGDPCRRVGESAATANFLDDSAILVGCPASDAAAIAALGGKTVGEVEGITLISISQGDANVGMTAPEAPPATEPGTSTQ
jgi:hypothetical protein